MKRLLSLGVVLSLAFMPASAFGVSMTVLGVGSLDIDTSGTIPIDVVVDSEGLNVTSVDFQLMASQTGVFDIASASGARNYGGTLNDPTWPDPLSGLGLDTINPDNLGATGLPAGSSFNGVETVVTIQMNYDTTGLVEGNMLTIDPITDLGFMQVAPRYGSVEGAGDCSATPLEITLTPEPTSIMLLLAAVPFLRRRRTV